MSALQASRKYGVPSRTLYDKVKKMGITTGRQVQRKSLPNYPSQFPGLSGVSILFIKSFLFDFSAVIFVVPILHYYQFHNFFLNFSDDERQ